MIWFDVIGILGHIGLAMYTFDGNVVILNVRAESKNQKDYPRIFKYALITSLTIFMVFATICYSTYKD